MINILGIIAFATAAAAMISDFYSLHPCVRNCLAASFGELSCENSQCACQNKVSVGHHTVSCSMSCTVEEFFQALRVEESLCEMRLPKHMLQPSLHASTQDPILRPTIGPDGGSVSSASIPRPTYQPGGGPMPPGSIPRPTPPEPEEEGWVPHAGGPGSGRESSRIWLPQVGVPRIGVMPPVGIPRFGFMPYGLPEGHEDSIYFDDHTDGEQPELNPAEFEGPAPRFGISSRNAAGNDNQARKHKSHPGAKKARGEEQAGDHATAAEDGNANVPATPAVSKRAMEAAATKSAVGLLALAACLLLAL